VVNRTGHAGAAPNHPAAVPARRRPRSL